MTKAQEYQMEYRKKNAERIKAQIKACRQRKKKEYAEKEKQWRMQNPEKIELYREERRKGGRYAKAKVL